jgi:hypothetical protein
MRVLPYPQVAHVGDIPAVGDRSVIKAAADLYGSAVSRDAAANVVTPSIHVDRGRTVFDVDPAAFAGRGWAAALRFSWRSRRDAKPAAAAAATGSKDVRRSRWRGRRILLGVPLSRPGRRVLLAFLLLPVAVSLAHPVTLCDG